MITRDDIEAASARIAGQIRTTPIVALEDRAWDVAGYLTLKLELLQHTGSFKPRGAFNHVLTNHVPSSGVIAASGGNHGAAVAYVARRLGHRAEIFVPASSPRIKVERLRGYQAHVTVVGATYGDAATASNARAAETDALVVHPYDQPEILAGQGTLGREFARQAPDLDTVLVAVGGGGLIGGVAAWFGDTARVVGVEPEGAPTLAEARRVGRPVDVPVEGVASDSLGARQVGRLAFAIAERYVDQVILVSDEAIVAAQHALWHDLRVVAEPGGATALAALISRQYRPTPHERVGIVICGGNTDPRTIA